MLDFIITFIYIIHKGVAKSIVISRFWHHLDFLYTFLDFLYTFLDFLYTFAVEKRCGTRGFGRRKQGLKQVVKQVMYKTSIQTSRAAQKNEKSPRVGWLVSGLDIEIEIFY